MMETSKLPVFQRLVLSSTLENTEITRENKTLPSRLFCDAFTNVHQRKRLRSECSTAGWSYPNTAETRPKDCPAGTAASGRPGLYL